MNTWYPNQLIHLRSQYTLMTVSVMPGMCILKVNYLKSQIQNLEVIQGVYFLFVLWYLFHFKFNEKMLLISMQ